MTLIYDISQISYFFSYCNKNIDYKRKRLLILSRKKTYLLSYMILKSDCAIMLLI